MTALTPASPSELPPLGDLVADDPFWSYPAALARRGVAHLRVLLTAGPEPGHLAVVTETDLEDSVTESAGRIWAELVRRYGPSLILLEHHPAPELSEGMETLDLVRVGADGSPHWTRVWPTPEDNPRYAGLELWMATYGHQIVSRPASEFDRCEDEDDLPSHACARGPRRGPRWRLRSGRSAAALAHDYYPTSDGIWADSARFWQGGFPFPRRCVTGRGFLIKLSV